ncbi:glycoside hydrolase family 18 [Paenibacillus darwinianus]|uniref:Glycoside hydrolase family 18 n=1 Tax=Paenibacillus darwinianus TaxID=1380763 RepID=A0A9W5S2V6_9BACL|nr:glycosyl hydrolase family 18 protein [Paenibacillus darwinianus]EXX89785.1 glycoside hydrolase family 18 [Paenibacillus darwinianus]EXX90149.1 glycoside hydrolase family 18 [Paenibacillus darwinianus]EXX90515.1 glycoside hydrolase family 18 [Paenibacillus darwinianus]
MNNRIKLGLALLLTVQAGLTAASAYAAPDADRMTKFRVYQNEKALREFATESQAVAYAKSFRYSRVEKIADRQWVWDNFPRYELYQNGATSDKWEYRTYAEALRIAKTMTNVHIRDLEQPGWVYSRYARYRVYQGDRTLPKWSFLTIAEAKKEAKFYGNIHIMDTVTNQWIWDNLTAAQKEGERRKTAIYQINADGMPTGGDGYSFLLDAIRAAASVPNSEVMNTVTGQIVHSNVPAYQVTQNGNDVRRFFGLDNAIAYAKTLTGAEIVKNGLVWWTNIPYLQVMQGDKLVRYFHTKKGALAFAKGYDSARIVTERGTTIWDNLRELLYLGWNGTSKRDTILSHVANTQGLDIDSPTWFELADATGKLTDTSDASVVAELQAKGTQVMPLVHNQFDSKLTSAFLADAAAQKSFIDALVGKLAEIGANGVNLDFEAMAGADRDRYTAFVSDLAAAARLRGLSISIDLPRGDIKWNSRTAYDHEKLAALVDHVVIMAYDQYWKGSDAPGSVSGLEWAEQGILDFLSYGIPRTKLMLGVPFYVREWKLDGTGKLLENRAILMKDVPALLASVKAKAEFDSRFGQTKYTYVKDGFQYIFWAETPQTTLARIDLAKKYDLAGVAAWRLGYEPAELWTSMLQKK